MSSTRSTFRLETRSRARDDIKRAVQSIDKVRKWEKQWVDLGLSNSIKIYKWVPVRDDSKEEEEEEGNNKENEPMELPTQSDPASLEGVRILSSSLTPQDLTPSENLPQNIMEDEESSDTTQSSLIPDNNITAHLTQQVVLDKDLSMVDSGQSLETVQERSQSDSPQVERSRSRSPH